MLHSSTPYLTRRARFLMGLTQAEFAELFGVETATVSRWETGKMKPHPHAWKRINEVAGIRDVLARESPVIKFVVPMDDLLHPTLVSKGLEAALKRYEIDHKEIYVRDNLLDLSRRSTHYPVCGAHALEMIQADPQWKDAAYAEAHCLSVLLGNSWSKMLIAPMPDTSQAILECVVDNNPQDPKDGFWVNVVMAADLPYFPISETAHEKPREKGLNEMHRLHHYRGGRLPHLHKKF